MSNTKPSQAAAEVLNGIANLNYGSDQKPAITQATDISGDWGSYQCKLVVLLSILSMFTPLHNLTAIFYAPKLDFQCVVPSEYQNSTAYQNYTLTSQCHSFDDRSKPCSKFQYNMGEFQSTVTDEWDLVCDKSWLRPAAFSVVQVGYFFSALIVGHISDRYGRYMTLKVLFLLEIVFGLSQALSVSIEMFLISRFLLGFASNGRFLCAFLLRIEWVGDKYRSRAAVIGNVLFTMGFILTVTLAYLLPHFRRLQLLIAGLQFTFLFTLPYIKESPRWLLTAGRYDDARHILVQVAKSQKRKSTAVINKEVDCLVDHMKREKVDVDAKESYFDLFRSAKLAKHTLVMYFTWFSVAFIYYGFISNVGDLGGNIFLNSLMVACARLVGVFFFAYGLKKLSRKRLLMSALLLSAVAFYTMIPIVSYLPWRIAVGVIGVSLVGIAFFTEYLYASEVFPTSIRQIATGSCSVFGRFGSISGPFVGKLTEHYHIGMTMGVFGTLAVFASLLTIFLPETKNKKIPNKVGEV